MYDPGIRLLPKEKDCWVTFNSSQLGLSRLSLDNPGDLQSHLNRRTDTHMGAVGTPRMGVAHTLRCHFAWWHRSLHEPEDELHEACVHSFLGFWIGH